MAVIFWDFDGTLVYSNPLWSTTVFNSLKEVAPNTDVKFTDIRKCMAKGFTWHTADEDYSDLIGDKWWEFMNGKIADDYIKIKNEISLDKYLIWYSTAERIGLPVETTPKRFFELSNNKFNSMFRDFKYDYKS